MKPTLSIAFALLAAMMPLAAGAQTALPLTQTASQRQEILDLELQLSVPGVPPAQAQQIQDRIAQLQSQINNGLPNLPVGAYGSCDADNGMVQMLQDQISSQNLDYSSKAADERAIYDLTVNAHQRGC